MPGQPAGGRALGLLGTLPALQHLIEQNNFVTHSNAKQTHAISNNVQPEKNPSPAAQEDSLIPAGGILANGVLTSIRSRCA